MKNYLLIILSILAFTGCRKYEEGPGLSLRSKKERVSNVWKIEKYFMNDEDRTAQIDSMYLTYTLRKDGSYQELMSHMHMYYIEDGKWSFIEDKSAIEIYRTNDTMTWHIKKLEEDALWVVYTPLAGFRLEYRLKPVE